MPTKRPAAKLHPRNLHQGRYNIKELCSVHPKLSTFVKRNPRGDNTIEFSSPQAIICLNQALLKHYYQIQHWAVPDDYLCPPIPGRADYVHYAADLLGSVNLGRDSVKVLDIGTGANLIYPIIGSQVYGWQFVGSDIDPVSVKSAKQIVNSNHNLSGKVKVVLQENKNQFFSGVIDKEDRVALTLCNPPFHASKKEAEAGTTRKWKNLKKSSARRGSQSGSISTKQLNFGGQSNELWCEGGELRFLSDMVRESAEFARQVFWFTSLVSKKENIAPLRELLTETGAKQVKVKAMSQGQKISHMLAWSFMDIEEHRKPQSQ
ncbi:23S rRNA methyltransferase [Endozoicomonas montiporae]|uniref:Ribosomal RNA large subunit methyltransferase F n=2 Tax=Endozoicomonas montiporae TaxID=1027273 RepID=A0A081N8D9_9GAMM|nr:23S rRNA (adenine(1618)-N(6))-methyltransferase RlmF [Endozoicomonas montiporae]AMO55398.1 23S rRNA (adenine1618-N6)-methyltransferase [Endozoicomonas montiporae CL-33]KEQ14712.1 23S rRNA methyltransferase [Endozoicomonas montiporae]